MPCNVVNNAALVWRVFMCTGGFAAAVTTPLDVAKTRIMLAKVSGKIMYRRHNRCLSPLGPGLIGYTVNKGGNTCELTALRCLLNHEWNCLWTKHYPQESLSF